MEILHESKQLHRVKNKKCNEHLLSQGAWPGGPSHCCWIPPSLTPLRLSLATLTISPDNSAEYCCTWEKLLLLGKKKSFHLDQRITIESSHTVRKKSYSYYGNQSKILSHLNLKCYSSGI